MRVVPDDHDLLALETAHRLADRVDGELGDLLLARGHVDDEVLVRLHAAVDREDRHVGVLRRVDQRGDLPGIREAGKDRIRALSDRVDHIGVDDVVVEV